MVSDLRRQVPGQWDPSLFTTDPIFKTNANYVAEFNHSWGYIPTYTTASGSAAGVTLCVKEGGPGREGGGGRRGRREGGSDERERLRVWSGKKRDREGVSDWERTREGSPSVSKFGLEHALQFF